MSTNCVFCQIASGQAQAAIVYQDERVTVFKDRAPAAPVHLLIIPNRHITSMNSVTSDDSDLLGYMLLIARQQAIEHNLNQDGYRLIINTGPNAGQTIFHLHLHLLGGFRLSGLAQ